MNEDSINNVGMNLLKNMRSAVGMPQLVISEFRKLGFDKAVTFLQATATDCSDPHIRSEAIEVLCNLSKELGFQAALPLLRESDPGMRCAGLRFIASTRIPEGVTLVIDKLQSDPEGPVRYLAASVLEKFGTSSALPVLRNAAANDNGTDFEGRPIRDVSLEAIKSIEARLAQ